MNVLERAFQREWKAHKCLKLLFKLLFFQFISPWWGILLIKGVARCQALLFRLVFEAFHEWDRGFFKQLFLNDFVHQNYLVTFIFVVGFSWLYHGQAGFLHCRKPWILNAFACVPSGTLCLMRSVVRRNKRCASSSKEPDTVKWSGALRLVIIQNPARESATEKRRLLYAAMPITQWFHTRAGNVKAKQWEFSHQIILSHIPTRTETVLHAQVIFKWH